MSSHHVAERVRGAGVRNVTQRDTGAMRHELGGDVRRGAETGRSIGELAGAFFALYDQFADGIRRKFRARD